MIYFSCTLGDCVVLNFFSRGVINSCSLRALPEYVEVSDESHVYITPATTLTAGWGSQWYQCSCTSAEKRREK